MKLNYEDPNAENLSDYLLVNCRGRGEILTNLKLQKLLFYADAWSLALRDKELINEQFQAWVHGPVLPSQYHRFKSYKWMPIQYYAIAPTYEPEVVAHLDEIITEFGSESAVALELMTHREKPWLEARGDLLPSEPSEELISKETTRDYYRTLM